MQIDRTDNFFRQKLYDNKVQPKEESWIEIEKRLSHKQYNIKNYGLAASFLLALSISFILYWYIPNHSQQLATVDYHNGELPKVSKKQQDLKIAHLTTRNFIPKIKEHKKIMKKHVKTLSINQNQTKKTRKEKLILPTIQPLGQSTIIAIMTPKIAFYPIEYQKETQIKRIVYIAFPDQPNTSNFAEKDRSFFVDRFLNVTGKILFGELVADINSKKKALVQNYRKMTKINQKFF